MKYSSLKPKNFLAVSQTYAAGYAPESICLGLLLRPRKTGEVLKSGKTPSMTLIKMLQPCLQICQEAQDDVSKSLEHGFSCADLHLFSDKADVSNGAPLDADGRQALLSPGLAQRVHRPIRIPIVGLACKSHTENVKVCAI